VSRIYWDTMLFVYWFEGHAEYSDRVQKIFTRMKERRDTLCTSIFTLGEVLTGPYRRDALDVIPRIRDFFKPPHAEILPFTSETSERYARIRGQHRVPPADAIHLAAAACAGVDLFLTNDRPLMNLVIPGIDFIAGMDVNLF
jgi:predicted nucleic acid-binding protein